MKQQLKINFPRKQSKWWYGKLEGVSLPNKTRGGHNGQQKPTESKETSRGNERSKEIPF